MDRLNPIGLPRDELAYTLTQSRFVMRARRTNSCLLCRKAGVNEAGLCDSCYVMLNDEELRLAERWLGGRGP